MTVRKRSHEMIKLDPYGETASPNAWLDLYSTSTPAVIPNVLAENAAQWYML